MEKIKNVVNAVLAGIKPSMQEEKNKRKKIKVFLKRLNKNLDGETAILGGSAKKGTWLMDSYDADIFVKFNYKKFREKSSKISDILGKSLRKEFKGMKRVHGSRDYFQIIENGFLFEIIPILNIKISDQAVNITDISPLHAKWVEKKMKSPDDIRLAKAFAKAQDVYGAESFIQGFSGYCIEILTIHYGSFIGFIKAVSKWKKRTTIDIMKYHKNIMIEVNKSKLISPLVLIDPVQKGRNVAAALSEKNYYKMINAAKSFLKNPSQDFFVRKSLSSEDVKQKYINKNTTILKINPKSGKEDVVGSRILKCFEYTSRKLVEKDFTLTDSGWYWDRKKESFMWFITKEKELKKEMIQKGPPTKLKDFVKEFRKKHKNNFIRKKIVFARIKRKYTTPKSVIKNVIKLKYITEKVKGIKIE